MTDKPSKRALLPVGVGAGIAIGVAIGMAIDNLAAGIGIGLALGIVFSVGARAFRRNDQDGRK